MAHAVRGGRNACNSGADDRNARASKEVMRQWPARGEEEANEVLDQFIIPADEGMDELHDCHRARYRFGGSKWQKATYKSSFGLQRCLFFSHTTHRLRYDLVQVFGLTKLVDNDL